MRDKTRQNRRMGKARKRELLWAKRGQETKSWAQGKTPKKEEQKKKKRGRDSKHVLKTRVHGKKVDERVQPE